MVHIYRLNEHKIEGELKGCYKCFYFSLVVSNWKHMMQPEHLLMKFCLNVSPIVISTPFTI